mgnify:CR=1 FL=1
MDKNVWYAVFESVEDIVVVINTDFEIEHINRKGEECFGLHGESLQSKKCYDYICQNESPPGECPMQCHLTGEKPGKDQVIQSGSRHFKIATTPVKDADGEIVRFVDVLHDITKELETEKTLREQNDEIRALNEEYMAANEELKARNEEVTSLNEEYNSIIEDLRQTNEQLQDAKKKIEESEEMFRTTFDLAAVGIAHVSTEGKFLRLNQKFCDITGYTKNELAGMTFTEITHPEDLYLDKKYISEVFEGKRDAFTIEKRYIHKNGGIIWVNLYSNIVRDSSGKVKYAVAAITDITHQKESEKQLVFQSVLLDNINDLITATDLEGNIIYTNRKVKEFFNYQKNTPKHVLDYGENRDLGATQEEIIKNTLNHEKWRGEVVNYTKDGKELFLECRTQLIKDEHGKPYGMIGASTDISAQKAYEKELQQKNEELESQNEEYLALNEELQQTLKKLQSINTELEQRDKKLSLLLKASQTVLLFEDFDTTARKLFGFCKEYTGAQSGYVALLDENGKENEILFLDSGGLECRVDKSLPMPIRGLRNEAFKSLQGIYHNDFMNSEWKKYIPEGHAALRNVLFAPLIINKNAVGLIGLANKPGDFTEADRQTVDAVSEMCSIALHNANVNEKLVQAKLRAEESDHLKTAFLANMSHEIRTPMNGIIGFSDMLMKSDLTEEKRRLYAKIVVDSGNQLLNIVNDILDISLIEANALKLYIEEIAVNTIIMDLFAFFKPQFAKKNLALYIHKSLTDEQSIIRTDKNRLQQILSNLLNNAFKFTQEGFIRFGYDVIEDNLQFIVEDTRSEEHTSELQSLLIT